MFIDTPCFEWANGSLSDIADIIMGQSPSGSSYNEDGIGTIFFRGLAAIHSKTNHQSFVLYTMYSLRKQLEVFN